MSDKIKQPNGVFYPQQVIINDSTRTYTPVVSVSGGGGSAIDRELVVTTYFCVTAFTGASVNDTITSTQIIDVTSAPTTVSVIWRNQTTATDLASTPSASTLTLVGSAALTNAQLRASALPVAVVGGNTVAVKTDGSATTQPVSIASIPLATGAATLAAQGTIAGDGGVQSHIMNFPSTQAVSGTFYPTTQPVSASALPLPTGASTAALQPALSGDGGSLAHVTNFPTLYPSSAIGYTLTQTSVTVGITSTALIAANSLRKYLSWMVVGTADVTVSVGTSSAVVGIGLVYQASGAGKQGSSEEFPNGAPVNAFQVIAPATGSIVVIWEGV